MLYLIHFNRPFRHARHYLGYSRDTDTLHVRLSKHMGESCDVRLLQHVKAEGIRLMVVRVWEGDRKDEMRLKRTHAHTRICPICSEKPWYGLMGVPESVLNTIVKAEGGV